jgi:acetyl esterase/lipase
MERVKIFLMLTGLNLNRMKNIFIVLLSFLLFSAATAQTTIPLYGGLIPGSKNSPDKESWNADSSLVFNVSKPTLTVFLPEKGKENGTAVIICPGGGYRVLVMKREGYEVAKEFNKIGVAAFVLKYRLPNDEIMNDKSEGPLQDAQQAIKIVRQRSAGWKIDENRIGIMGFSAGGHLASTAATHFSKSLSENSEKISLRPDFQILVYPVISMKENLGHKGSREALLGTAAGKDLVETFSNEMQVSPETPPAFIIHGSDDHVVPVENSILYYEALSTAKVPSSLHLFAHGEHGFPSGLAHDSWLNYCMDWLKDFQNSKRTK